MPRGGRTGAGGAPAPTGAEDRFAAACRQIRAASQKHVAQYQLSDSEEEEEVGEETRDQILGKLCSGVGGRDGLGYTSAFVQRALDADATTCLICIGTVKRTDPIWCCAGCHVGFHLACVQKWAKDSISQHLLRVENGDAKQVDLSWHCPNCRCAYQKSEVPARYLCYCGKVVNPPADPWLLPHACGQRCQKNLKPDCGHRCLLQCHPGPCPPCPATVKTRCYCGKSGPDVRRCGNKAWACRQPCGKLLDCQTHRCTQPCHPGACAACPETSEQRCQCGRRRLLRPCATPSWQCDQVCGRPLSCGQHTCAEVCHRGACGPCPRAGRRRCPCGRTEVEVPCHQEVPTCGDTCDKQLACGVHRCTSRCHPGHCARCLQLRLKRCRCGRKEKKIVCDKEFTCEVKCKRLKDCGKHTCNRKCCTGDCPPCEQSCGKSLPCRTHKCSSPCHTGPCYPCPLSAEVVCPCGHARVTVPCGRQRSTRPPRCRRPCDRPPSCHHPSRERHGCHSGSCPPCTQPCGRLLDCGRQHRCPQPCHQQVTRRVTSQRAATPWEQQQDRVVTVTLPCPPCQAAVPVACPGGHALYPMPCCRAQPEPCGRSCGRLLACGNHRCQQPCHVVEEPPDSEQAGRTCDTCQLPCTCQPPAGCTHNCPRGCHAGECPPCRQHRRLRCHCQVSLLHVRCHQLTEAEAEGGGGTEALLSCGNTCPKLLECGHRCVQNCHSGACPPPPDGCPAKVRLRCGCGRLSRSALCRELTGGSSQLDCDDSCRDRLQQQAKEQEVRQAAEMEAEAARRRAEVEALERKLGGRRRERRRRHTVTEEDNSSATRRAAAAAAVAVLLAAAVYLLYQ